MMQRVYFRAPFVVITCLLRCKKRTLCPMAPNVSNVARFSASKICVFGISYWLFLIINNVVNSAGYRDGNNLRKMKSHLVPGLPSTMYHKQMRHANGFQPPHSRDSRSAAPPPPPPLDSNNSHMLQHQSTPLARLSPSSELSQQLPRILTLRVRTLLIYTAS